MIGVNAWWVYLAPQNIPRANVLTLGNKVVFLTLYVLGSIQPARLYQARDSFSTRSRCWFTVLAGNVRTVGPPFWPHSYVCTALRHCWLMIGCTALFSALLSRLTALACGSTWVTSFFIARFLSIIHRSGVLTALTWLVPHETAAVSAQVLCTPYNHAPCHFMQSHIRKVYECLAVTCHLHFWQNDRGLLRATAVTRGWNGYRNKSQHRKSTLEKNILLPLLQGFEPATFRSRVRRSNHWPIPAPCMAILRIESQVFKDWTAAEPFRVSRNRRPSFAAAEHQEQGAVTSRGQSRRKL